MPRRRAARRRPDRASAQAAPGTQPRRGPGPPVSRGPGAASPTRAGQPGGCRREPVAATGCPHRDRAPTTYPGLRATHAGRPWPLGACRRPLAAGVPGTRRGVPGEPRARTGGPARPASRPGGTSAPGPRGTDADRAALPRRAPANGDADDSRTGPGPLADDDPDGPQVATRHTGPDGTALPRRRPPGRPRAASPTATGTGAGTGAGSQTRPTAVSGPA